MTPDEVREWRQQPIVIDADGATKPLDDCTAADLGAAAAVKYAQAKAITEAKTFNITTEDCGCVRRHYPDGSWTDSGCLRHMPHRSDEGPRLDDES
jgi:hypothetical protein